MDPDVDLSLPDERAELSPSPFPVLAAISVGGVLGALARYGLGAAWPHAPGAVPWSTWAVNVSGCLLIGVLQTLIARARIGPSWTSWHLVRPFLGVGFLGGYTTFSASVVDVQHVPPAMGLLYLGVTVLGALVAVWAGSTLTALAVR